MRELNLLMENIVLGECPRWHDGRLWFSDWGAREMIAVGMDGRHEVVDRFEVMPFSFDWLPNGEQVVIAGQTLYRRGRDGVRAAWVDLSEYAEKGWNEIVADGRGNVYVNNVNFDFPGGEFRPGHAALVRPDGTVEIVARDLAFPNGMAVTADGETLIVGESFSTTLSAFDIGATGSLGNRRVWAKLTGGPDGITMDQEGCVWSSAYEAAIRVKEGGEVLETIALDRFCFATMLGGDDGRTLFLVCNEWKNTTTTNLGKTGRIYWTRVETPRAGWPG